MMTTGDVAGGSEPRKLGRLRGKVAIVTGGASGIGAAIVRRFSGEGARQLIVGLAAEEEKAGSVISELGPDSLLFLAGDITDPATAARAVTAVTARWGRLDVLVNNAGIDYSGIPVLDSDPAVSRRVMEVNFFGALFMLQEAARAMRAAPLDEDAGAGAGPANDVPADLPAEPAGAIVNIASRAGVVGVRTMAVYGASKAALVSLTRTAALELAPQIRVNAVAPGATQTPMMRTWIEEQNDPIAFERALSASIPLDRLARPREIADAVLFLASDESSHITGTVLPVDGGYTAG
jgi:NAD(P)-dependent dehydrogenase (short-subunit alcohol dehydrogenase family)